MSSEMRPLQSASHDPLDKGISRVMRTGKAEIRLAVKPAKAYKVYALSTGGRRVAPVETRVVKGRLAFTAAVDGQPDSATLLYEIVKE